MNNEQMVHAGNTMGQRLRMAAVRIGEVFGGAGLLTLAAVEGGAALNVNTPLVEQVEAGTGIPGVVISSSCNPRSNQPQLTIANNTSGRLDFKASVNGGPFEFAGTVEPKDSLTGSAKAGDRYVHTADQIPGAQDEQVISACSTTTTVNTTSSTAFVPTPTTGSPTTSTTRNPNTGASIPGGEQGQPAATTGPTTTTANSVEGGFVNKPSTGNESASGQQNTTTATTRLAGPTTPQAGRTLALTGNETGNLATGGAVLTAAGALLIILGRRKKQQSAA